MLPLYLKHSIRKGHVPSARQELIAQICLQMSKTVKITARDFNLVLCPYTVSWCVRPTAHWQLAREDSSNCSLRLQLCRPGLCSKITLVTGFIRVVYGLVCTGASNHRSATLHSINYWNKASMWQVVSFIYGLPNVDSQMTKLLSLVVSSFVSLGGVGGFFKL